MHSRWLPAEDIYTRLSSISLANCAVPLPNNVYTWSPASVSVLAASHWSVGIRQLALCRALLNAAAIAELVNGNFPVLSVFKLDDNALGSQATSHLRQGTWPDLKHLSLRENELDEIAIRRLVQGTWPLLQHVDLFHNSLGSGGVRALGRGNWVNVQFLDVGRNLCGYDGLSALAEGNWPLLRELRLSEGWIDAAAFIILLKEIGHY